MSCETTGVGKEDRQLPRASQPSSALSIQPASTHRGKFGVQERGQNWGTEFRRGRAQRWDSEPAEMRSTAWNKLLFTLQSRQRRKHHPVFSRSARVLTVLKHFSPNNVWDYPLSYYPWSRGSWQLNIKLVYRQQSLQQRRFPSKGSNKPACPHPLLTSQQKETLYLHINVSDLHIDQWKLLLQCLRQPQLVRFLSHQGVVQEIFF